MTTTRAQPQDAAMTDFARMGTVEPLAQDGRPRCSIPLEDANLKAGNANWTKGLQSMSDWIWSGNLNPAAFPNNLGRFFLQIPGVFEQQLNYSTTLIFDEPSFKNGVRISGMVPQPVRELAISLIAQRRRCWYSMTHHAVLGKLTAAKHGMSDADFGRKWSQLATHREHADAYTPLERAVLEFADAFATNPKAYTDKQYASLREALAASARERASDDAWLRELQAARQAQALAQGLGLDPATALARSRTAAAAASGRPTSDAEIERLVNAQVVELAFVCLQFVALTDVFTALNVPDESFLSDVLKGVVPAEVIARINQLNQQGSAGMLELVPPTVELPLEAILQGRVIVEPVPLRGARIPLVPYETDASQGTRDKGVTLGGAQIGVYGWSFGSHFPGSLVYAVMHHPELARYETAYSLPVLFNEDEWRNGVQTAGFLSWRFKEIIYQKVYRTIRSRYGIEHHNMFLLNAYQRQYGAGPFRAPELSDSQAEQARQSALRHANAAAAWAQSHRHAPAGTYTDSEAAMMDWLEVVLRRPHDAHSVEPALRDALAAENRREVDGAVRRLDTSLDGDRDAALKRLLDHQIAELAMTAGHMNGLGRLLTMLRLESEDAVQAFAPGPDGKPSPTGYFQDRPGFLELLRMIGLSDATSTCGELLLNPSLNERVKVRLASGEKVVKVTAAEAAPTAEF